MKRDDKRIKKAKGNIQKHPLGHLLSLPAAEEEACAPPLRRAFRAVMDSPQGASMVEHADQNDEGFLPDNYSMAKSFPFGVILFVEMYVRYSETAEERAFWKKVVLLAGRAVSPELEFVLEFTIFDK